MNAEMEGMLDTYLFETNGLLDRLDEILMEAEKVGEFSTDNVNEIFRIMHTIKGSSAMMELTPISVIAHRIEDLFFFIRDKGIEFLNEDQKKGLFDLMFKSEDYLRGEVGKVEAGEEVDPDITEFQSAIEAYLQKLKDGEAGAEGAAAASGGDTAAPAAAGSSNLPDDPSAQVFIHIFLEDGIGMENLRAFMIVNALKENGIDFRFYPADMDQNPDSAKVIIEDGFYLAFDSLDTANMAEEGLKTQAYIKSTETLDAPKPEDKPEPAPAAAPEPAPAPAAEAPAAAAAPKPAAPAPAPAADKKPAAKSNAPVKSSLISVNLQKLDALNDLVGEIVITESMVTSSPVLNQLPQEEMDSFLKSARQLRKLTDDLQDISMSLRMVSISGVFQKMSRIVRDMKTKLNKDVRLTVIGEDTEVDKTIVDAIQDPIMHIVRNSMDHGIEETAQERIAAGKDPQGELILSATHTSSEVVIEVKDDGYGMDPDKLLQKGEERGILTKPKDQYSKKEALGLIMLPGFSTNKQVTEYSGRGVGMDVVKKNLESVGGTLSIDSDLGKGTTMTMKIPLTLSIVDGMKVAVGDTTFTIPIANIRSSFKIDNVEVIRDENGNEMIDRDGEFYPIVKLNEFYNIRGKHDDDMTEGIMVWVEYGDKSCCLYADELIGEQQVVVKPLPQFVSIFDLKSRGISGCTILGDGTISIILDVLGVYNAAIENA
ncbi:two-component system, chemotaxis family, sensor kinase CheA [Oribacterium sp. KHPX15]|uniref:chemotaxis protein CheA n=1 Tax=unclassified Oribacterium TaxID=2629782 RepID=UPI0004E1BC0D|nr:MULTISPECIES: chemotaxis protein CheA [unclassified Oribacterium]SEA43770.1 two-component system, chemotaxis family, sensor kinase CheA [Oribacterium sp. KHPX15]